MSPPLHKLSALALGLVLLLRPNAGAQTRSIPISDYRLVRIDGRTDVLRMADDKLERLDGNSLASVWRRGLTAADQPRLAHLKTPDDDPTATLRFIRRILTTCPDLNGDGKGDFVFGLDFQPDLVAVDGTNGEVLWWHRNRARPDGMKEGPFADDRNGDSFVLAEPLLYDVDGDGVPDLITGFSCAAVTFRDNGDPEKTSKRPAETLIQAVSGRSGKLLWSYPLADTRFGRPTLSTDFHDYSQILGTWKGEPAVTIVAKGQLWTLKLKTGEPVGAPVKLPGLRLGDPYPEHARFFDPDGTGELAVLILNNGKEIQPADTDPTPHLQVAAVRAATGEVLWEVEQEGLTLAWRPQQDANGARACDWPAPFRFSTKADDKREDVLLPFKQRRKEARGLFWHGLERLDGRTGKSVWRKRILLDEDTDNNHLTISRLSTGPDLNGDGCPELFTAFGVIDPPQRNATRKVVRAGTPHHEHVCVTALSGADGGLLWQQQTPDGLKQAQRFTSGLAPLQWQRPAANVRAQLVIPRVDPYDGRSCFVWIVEPATGFVRDSLQGMEWIDAPDGQGFVFGHVPGSWNPRYTPEQGQLIQWQPTLKTDDSEANTLPAADATVNLPTLPAFPWQARPLPWAGTQWVVWEIGGGVFVALLAVLLFLRRWRSALAFLLLVLLISGGASYWLIHNDARAMDAEEYYVSTNWYGIAPITATIFVPFVGLYALLRPGKTRAKRAIRQ
jgi:hypothetical protein